MNKGMERLQEMRDVSEVARHTGSLICYTRQVGYPLLTDSEELPNYQYEGGMIKFVLYLGNYNENGTVISKSVRKDIKGYQNNPKGYILWIKQFGDERRVEMEKTHIRNC